MLMPLQAVAEHFNLDGVLTLVDAKHVGQHLDEEKEAGVVNEAIAQVAYADRIILNKTDLVRTPFQAPSWEAAFPHREGLHCFIRVICQRHEGGGVIGS